MNYLHVALEAVDKAPLLLVAVEVILTLASIYPLMFTKYFTVSNIFNVRFSLGYSHITNKEPQLHTPTILFDVGLLVNQ